MIAYRVEHKDFKCGPYNVPADNIYEDADLYWEVMDAVYVCRSRCSGDRHPGPRTEWPHWSHEVHSGPYIFGFESLEQLREWFDLDTRVALNRVGYVIKTYEMSDFMKGQAQIAFNKLSAKPLTTLPLVG